MDRLLLASGIAYAVSYVMVNDVIAAGLYDGYNRMDQAVSELSAKGASPRVFLMVMLPIWTILMIGFGLGVWKAAHGRRALRAVGAIVVAYGVMAVTWAWFPMTSRAEMVTTGGAGNDAGHLVLTAFTILFILAELFFADAAFGRRFRLYSYTTAVVVVAFGGLVGPQAAKLADGQPTPWMGLYERISIGGWLLWMTVLAAILLRERRTPGKATRDLDTDLPGSTNPSDAVTSSLA